YSFTVQFAIFIEHAGLAIYKRYPKPYGRAPDCSNNRLVRSGTDSDLSGHSLAGKTLRSLANINPGVSLYSSRSSKYLANKRFPHADSPMVYGSSHQLLDRAGSSGSHTLRETDSRSRSAIATTCFPGLVLSNLVLCCSCIFRYCLRMHEP